ncbi:hypothetical protein CHS0354_033190 [Potamilus streckersoni]|uniref:Ribosomal L1 domain-containing protein 1 n=1 Tax=Potamilus streckersoni TaxID=2493646 RepID=A0AAE0S6H2_9BIVA|nr:hypothetical protein CHS0354_033190 [Potamilus streckersoni]
MEPIQLPKAQVDKAVTVLLNLHVKKQNEKIDIVDVPNKLDLQFNFKKVPLAKNKRIKISLPNSIHYDTREVCLFVKDLDRKSREYEVTVRHFQQLLDSKGISKISKIVPVKALRTDYSPFDAKKSLAKAYDLFLADERIVGLLPGILGKAFFSKKCNHPVQVNMNAKDLKTELENAINNTHCILAGRGSSSMVTVAHTDLTQEQIVENVIAAASKVSQSIQGGPKNIKNFYIKSTDTTAIPLYISLDSGEDVELPLFKRAHAEEYIDDVTTVEEGKVKVCANGAIQVVDDSGKPIRNLKRSHEDDEERQSTKKKRKAKQKSKSAKS